jgi:hypothetical protein
MYFYAPAPIISKTLLACSGRQPANMSDWRRGKPIHAKNQPHHLQKTTTKPGPSSKYSTNCSLWNSWKPTVPYVGNSSSLQAKVFRDWRKFLRGVEISSIFMKYRGRAVLDDFKKITHIVVEILLRTQSRPST